MSFGGSMGAAGLMTPSAVLFVQPTEGSVLYTADDAIEIRTSGGGHIAGGDNELLRTIAFSMSDNNSPSTPVLAGFANASKTGGAADSGLLVTGDPATTLGGVGHGIPTNFGPGRGGWNANFLRRLKIEFLSINVAIPAANNISFSPLLIFLTDAGTNIAILFKNTGGSLESLVLNLQFDHTLVF